MKITIEIPDFVPKERIIHIMAGIERVGYIMPNGKQFIKVSQCSNCGECCKKVGCEYLEKEPGDNNLWRCKKGPERPFICCISEPKQNPDCTSKYREI